MGFLCHFAIFLLSVAWHWLCASFAAVEYTHLPALMSRQRSRKQNAWHAKASS
jgi:hypothetical protein